MVRFCSAPLVRFLSALDTQYTFPYGVLHSAIVVGDSSAVTITGNTIDGNEPAETFSEEVTVTETFPPCTLGQSVGIAVSNSTDVIIQGNSAERNLVGISVGDSSDVTVVGNTSRGHCTGISVGVDVAQTGAVTISKNNTSSNFSSGISVVNASSAAITGNTTDRNGNGIRVQGVAGPVITGNTISNNTTGVLMEAASPTIEGNTFVGNGTDISIPGTGTSAKFNRFLGSAAPGYVAIVKDVGAPVDADNNWWADPTGPHHPVLNPGGNGVPISDAVAMTQWLRADISGAASQGTVAGEQTLDFLASAGVQVIKRGTGTPHITVAQYFNNPGARFTDFTAMAGGYLDLSVENVAGVTEIVLRAPVPQGINPSDLRARWWDGSQWNPASHQATVTIGGDDFLDVTVASSTSPSLGDLGGTPIAIGTQGVNFGMVTGTVTLDPPFLPASSVIVTATEASTKHTVGSGQPDTVRSLRSGVGARHIRHRGRASQLYQRDMACLRCGRRHGGP